MSERLSITSVQRSLQRAGVVSSLLCIALGVPLSAAASNSPMRIVVEPSFRSGGTIVYPLAVRLPGTPVLVLLPQSVHFAELVVNGAVVGSAGRNVTYGAWPFGHGASSFRLSGLSAHDRVQIRMSDASGPPKILSAAAPIETAFGSGLASGIFLGMLAATAISQLLLALKLKDRAFLIYIGWIAAVFGIEIVRVGFIAMSGPAAVVSTLVLGTVAVFCAVSFTAVYLRLPRDAPRLFYALIVTNVAVVIAPALVAAIARKPVDTSITYAANAVGIVASIAIALLRRRAGFMPASYLAFGLLGFLTVFAAHALRHAAHIESPFFDRWALELGAAFDFSIFAAALAYRSHFMQVEGAALSSAVLRASFEAGHDQLTGLLNRRGFDDWIASLQRPLGTLLFLDLDGFKAINDEGGHAAGDDVLGIVARIIRHSVRAGDAVARFGGDEFVVVMNGCLDPAVVQASIARISASISALEPLGAESATRIGVSIGSAHVGRGTAVSAALHEADDAAYRMKAEHRSEIGVAGRI